MVGGLLCTGAVLGRESQEFVIVSRMKSTGVGRAVALDVESAFGMPVLRRPAAGWHEYSCSASQASSQGPSTAEAESSGE